MLLGSSSDAPVISAWVQDLEQLGRCGLGRVVRGLVFAFGQKKPSRICSQTRGP
jgi:hypothetical protein